jgi:AcrR family transcriptional regulator
MTHPGGPRRLTAAERRAAVVDAALRPVAARGFAGTPTSVLADAAGITQPYLFHLFATKAELVLAVCEHCNEVVYQAFADAAARAHLNGESVINAIGIAYVELVRDRDTLMVQLHAFAAAAAEPRIRAVMQASLADLRGLLTRHGGLSDTGACRFLADGMVLNVEVNALGMPVALVLDTSRYTTRSVSPTNSSPTVRDQAMARGSGTSR